MHHEYPEYYTEFQCVGGSCTDSCCISWELDIDDETYDYYRNVTGEFGDRLRGSMSSSEENTFVLCNDGRCPFLNSENLCDIYINLGEAALCSVCTEFPRSHECVGDYMQSDIGMACPEVSGLIFGNPHHILYLSQKDCYDSGEEMTVHDRKRLKILLNMRNTLIKYIQSDNTGKTWREKAAYILSLADEWQQHWNSGEYRKLKADIRHTGKKNCRTDNIRNEGIITGIAGCTNNNDMLDLTEGMEYLDDTIPSMVRRYRRIYDAALWERFVGGREPAYNIWMEKIMSYYIFRYMIRAYYDNNVYTKVLLAVYSCIVTECLDYVRWHDNNYTYTVEDRMSISQKYSKEIEHSEENLEYLEEEFLFL